MHTLLSPLLASGLSPFPTRAHDDREEHSPLPPPPPTERERERACFHSQKRSELSGGGGGGQRQQRLQVPSPPRAPPQHRNPTPTLHCKARRGEAGPSAVGLRGGKELASPSPPPTLFGAGFAAKSWNFLREIRKLYMALRSMLTMRAR